LVFVGVAGLRLLDTPSAAVRVGPELVMREVALVARRRGERRGFALDEIGWHFVDETRRFAGLVFAEDSAARGACQDEARAGAGHPDVTESSLLLQLLLVVAGAGVREQPFLEAREHDDR